MHADEIEIDDGLVRRLVDRDVPQFAGSALQRLSAVGSSNVLFRLGHDHLVRLPRQPDGSTSVATEARWLPRLGPALPVAVPDVVAVGGPGFGYPGRWAVTRWQDGRTPVTPQPDGPAADALAADLAAFVTALHAAPVPDEATVDPSLRSYRSRALSGIDDEIRRYVEDCRSLPGLQLDLETCLEVWTGAVALPAPGRQTGRWVHGDLLGENLLVDDDRLSAVLDFGGLAVGDPTVDLVVAWEVLGVEARAAFRSRLDVDEVTWLRGRGWALAIALMTFPYYWSSMPQRCAARLSMAHQVIDDHTRRSRRVAPS